MIATTKESTLAYIESGEGEHCIVLLHGLFGQVRNLGALARALSARYRVISIDLPGHGDSPHANRYTHATMAESVHRTLVALQLQHYMLLGHSLGGKVAMRLALAYPDAVRRLMVLDIAPVQYEPRHEQVFNALLQVEPEKLRSRSEADEVLARSLPEPAMRQFLLQNLRRSDNGYAWKCDLEGLRGSYAALSAAVEAGNGNPYARPALFLGGGRSDYLLPEHEPLLHALFPAARLEFLPNAGHWLHAEAPSKCAELALKFFAGE